MGWLRLSIERPIFISMITLFLLSLGVLALRSLPIDLYPSVSYPVLAVRTNLPGAAPEEVEQLVTKKIEDALSTVAGLQTIRSNSREGTSQVVLEFGLATDVRFQEVQVRGIVGNLLQSLPKNVVPPSIFRQDPDDVPILEIAVSGSRTIAEVTRLVVDVIVPKLSQVPGVGSVDQIGARTPEIQIELRPEALARWQINATDIVQAIKDFNQNNPAGQLEGHDRIWLLRYLSKAAASHDLGRIPVGHAATGQPVYLQDVARIVDGFTKIQRQVSIGDASRTTPGLVLNVVKQSGENTVAVSDAVRAAIPELTKSLPSDIRLIVTRDDADLVRSNVQDVFESLALGAILTVIVVLLFLRSPRSTITTGISLPSSIITTFAIMFAAGFTINIMTLLSLSLAVGLLVDDAIVVRENIFRHLHLGAADARAAALNGTREVALAVTATTLTIVAIFLPVAFMGGVSGQFFKPFALTVVFAVLVSLWDAVTMAPMLSAYFANIPDPSLEWRFLGRVGAAINHALEAFEHAFDRLARGYARLLAVVMPRPWIAGLIAAAAIGAAAFGFQVVKKTFLPSQLGIVFNVSMDGPLAVPPVRGYEFGRQVDERLRKIDGLENWTIRAGADPTGRVNVDATCRIKREFATSQSALSDVRERVEKALNFLPGFIVDIEEPSDPLAGSTGRFQPLAVVVSGDDIDKLRTVAEEVRAALVSVKGVAGAAPIMTSGLPELRLRAEPEFTAQFGLVAQQVSDMLSTWVDGDISNSIEVEGKVVPIRVRLDSAKAMSPRELLDTSIYTKDHRGKSLAVPVSSLVRMSTGAGAAIITRENRERVIRIGAQLAKGAALGDIVHDLQAKLDTLPFPRGYSARIVGQNQQMNELYRNVGVAIGIGSVFVYMILASLFESLLQPLTVMAAIPLAASGAVLPLVGFGMALDLYAGIGIVLLAGIVAKNSILLVDFAMQRMRAGDAAGQAMLNAAPTRLRPILMTSIAMVAGMVPVALGLGSGGEARQTLGVATIGGVLSSTLLSLLVVPNLFVLVSRFSRRPSIKVS